MSNKCAIKGDEECPLTRQRGEACRHCNEGYCFFPEVKKLSPGDGVNRVR